MKRLCVMLCSMCCAAGAYAGQQPAATPGPGARPAQTGTAQARPSEGQAAHQPSGIQRRVENYLRDLYALGPKFEVKVGEPQPTPIPGLRAVSVEISAEGQSNGATMYVSEDGRYLMQSDLADMTVDPFAKIREEMDLSSAPSRGPANAKVVVVEYGDLECPSCRRLSEVLRGLYPDYPQVRFVFREFPLTQIHPWSMTAAIAGRCLYHKNHAAFWPYEAYIYDHQDLISAENIWDTVVQQGVQAGYDADSFKACMANPEMKAEVEKSTAEGVNLKVANTPTVFVNGRRLVGGERDTLVQFIDYELARTSAAKKP
jgi:protein-disulfide isomerase